MWSRSISLISESAVTRYFDTSTRYLLLIARRHGVGDSESTVVTVGRHRDVLEFGPTIVEPDEDQCVFVYLSISCVDHCSECALPVRCSAQSASSTMLLECQTEHGCSSTARTSICYWRLDPPPHAKIGEAAARRAVCDRNLYGAHGQVSRHSRPDY